MARGLLNPSEGSRYPNLKQVLHQRIRELDVIPVNPMAVTMGTGVAALALILSVQILLLQIALLPLLAIPYFVWKQFEKRKQPDLAYRLEKVAVLKRMSACIESNRLEHDISGANVALLEGCATAYMHARAALEQWQPGYSLDVKRRIGDGIGEAMDEAILAHRDALPENPTSLPFGVQLGKVADVFLFGQTTSSNGPLEPAFSRTRVLADQLRDAAHSVEDAARELTGKAPAPIKSASLTDALSDLKMMQQAEDELRQDLHGGA